MHIEHCGYINCTYILAGCISSVQGQALFHFKFGPAAIQPSPSRIRITHTHVHMHTYTCTCTCTCTHTHTHTHTHAHTGGTYIHVYSASTVNRKECNYPEIGWEPNLEYIPSDTPLQAALLPYTYIHVL